MASPAQDKLALSADRFRARADVYAVRWDNARTGAAKWMPAVAGGWRNTYVAWWARTESSWPVVVGGPTRWNALPSRPTRSTNTTVPTTETIA
ncbi:hypothetical protein [Micromonospora sp. KC207]|uniref:TOTE conflict system archaeo-eukaryotic primase domain-containing protein n=1 Tax=Micromonospora sp. KC207 TaxID=2530377 RepID=UPI0026D2BFBC